MHDTYRGGAAPQGPPGFQPQQHGRRHAGHGSLRHAPPRPDLANQEPIFALPQGGGQPIRQGPPPPPAHMSDFMMDLQQGDVHGGPGAPGMGQAGLLAEDLAELEAAADMRAPSQGGTSQFGPHGDPHARFS